MSWISKVRKADPDAAILETVPDDLATPSKVKGEVHQVTVQVRPASGNDPGEVALAWFAFEAGKVVLTSEQGSPEGLPIDCPPTRDPRSVARAAAFERLQGDGRFNRRLSYQDYGIV